MKNLRKLIVLYIICALSGMTASAFDAVDDKNTEIDNAALITADVPKSDNEDVLTDFEKKEKAEIIDELHEMQAEPEECKAIQDDIGSENDIMPEENDPVIENLDPDMAEVKLDGDETLYESGEKSGFANDTEPDRNITESLSGTYVITGSENTRTNVFINLDNISVLADKGIRVIYDPYEFELVDGCVFTKAPDIGSGHIAGTNISIVSAVCGEIVFCVNKDIPSGCRISGTVNIMQFDSLINGSKTIEYDIIDID